MRPQNAIYGSMDRGKHATMMLGKKRKKKSGLRSNHYYGEVQVST
jgi:hypothetical protein